jgi:hypothetical protein
MAGYFLLIHINNPEMTGTIRIFLFMEHQGVQELSIQLANYFVAHVTAVYNTGNIATVQSPVADKVMDHTREDFTKTGSQFYLILMQLAKPPDGPVKNY